MGVDKNGYTVDNYGNVCYMANTGIGFSYRIAEKWTGSLESSVYLPGDLGKPWDGGFKGYYIYNSVGLAYNFGVTEYDKVRIEQESQLTQENFDALAQERDQAKAELNGVTLESLVVAERVARAVKLNIKKGILKEEDFPLLLHIDEILSDKKQVNIPWEKFTFVD